MGFLPSLLFFITTHDFVTLFRRLSHAPWNKVGPLGRERGAWNRPPECWRLSSFLLLRARNMTNRRIRNILRLLPTSILLFRRFAKRIADLSVVERSGHSLLWYHLKGES